MDGRLHRGVVLILLAGLTAVPSAGAGTRSTLFSVTARVVGRVTLQTIDAPAAITVSAADLAQGYKDVAASYRVHTARLDRYVLTFAPRVGIADSVTVHGLAAPVTMASSEVAVLQPAQSRADELQLRFHFELRPGIEPGTYALPVAVYVSPH